MLVCFPKGSRTRISLLVVTITIPAVKGAIIEITSKFVLDKNLSLTQKFFIYLI